MSPFLAVACKESSLPGGTVSLIAPLRLWIAASPNGATAPTEISPSPSSTRKSPEMPVHSISLALVEILRRAGGVVQLHVAAVDRQGSGDRDHFDVGPAGMEMDRRRDVGQIGIPEEVAIQPHPALTSEMETSSSCP